MWNAPCSSELVTCEPRPVRSRSRSAAIAAKAASSGVEVSPTIEPLRRGGPASS